MMKLRLAFSFVLCVLVRLVLAQPTMRIHSIDVGQGAATLVEFKCGAILVDSGGDSTEANNHLVAYLAKFFDGRRDLNKTLAAVVLTHCHKDHARGLKAVASRFKVKRYIYNTFETGSGASDQKAFFNLRRTLLNTKRVGITDDIVAAGGSSGYTDADVDPLSCATCDPQVRILASRQTRSTGEYKNQNNHSVVLRFDLGDASFLITGDAEEAELEHLIARFQGSSTLDTDVYLAGHHGSRNATSKFFLEQVTPEWALVPCGRWDDGRFSRSNFNTFSYGHPNKGVLDALAEHIDRQRTPIAVKVGIRAKTFVDYTVSKAIYSTGWDGDVVLEGKPDGTFRVVRP